MKSTTVFFLLAACQLLAGIVAGNDPYACTGGSSPFDVTAEFTASASVAGCTYAGSLMLTAVASGDLSATVSITQTVVAGVLTVDLSGLDARTTTVSLTLSNVTVGAWGKERPGRYLAITGNPALTGGDVATTLALRDVECRSFVEISGFAIVGPASSVSVTREKADSTSSGSALSDLRLRVTAADRATVTVERAQIISVTNPAVLCDGVSKKGMLCIWGAFFSGAMLRVSDTTGTAGTLFVSHRPDVRPTTWPTAWTTADTTVSLAVVRSNFSALVSHDTAGHAIGNVTLIDSAISQVSWLRMMGANPRFAISATSDTAAAHLSATFTTVSIACVTASSCHGVRVEVRGTHLRAATMSLARLNMSSGATDLPDRDFATTDGYLRFHGPGTVPAGVAAISMSSFDALSVSMRELAALPPVDASAAPNGRDLVHVAHSTLSWLIVQFGSRTASPYPAVPAHTDTSMGESIVFTDSSISNIHLTYVPPPAATLAALGLVSNLRARNNVTMARLAMGTGGIALYGSYVSTDIVVSHVVTGKQGSCTGSGAGVAWADTGFCTALALFDEASLTVEHSFVEGRVVAAQSRFRNTSVAWRNTTVKGKMDTAAVSSIFENSSVAFSQGTVVVNDAIEIRAGGSFTLTETADCRTLSFHFPSLTTVTHADIRLAAHGQPPGAAGHFYPVGLALHGSSRLILAPDALDADPSWHRDQTSPPGALFLVRGFAGGLQLGAFTLPAAGQMMLSGLKGSVYIFGGSQFGKGTAIDIVDSTLTSVVLTSGAMDNAAFTLRNLVFSGFGSCGSGSSKLTVSVCFHGLVIANHSSICVQNVTQPYELALWQSSVRDGLALNVIGSRIAGMRLGAVGNGSSVAIGNGSVITPTSGSLSLDVLFAGPHAGLRIGATATLSGIIQAQCGPAGDPCSAASFFVDPLALRQASGLVIAGLTGSSYLVSAHRLAEHDTVLVAGGVRLQGLTTLTNIQVSGIAFERANSSVAVRDSAVGMLSINAVLTSGATLLVSNVTGSSRLHVSGRIGRDAAARIIDTDVACISLDSLELQGPSAAVVIDNSTAKGLFCHCFDKSNPIKQKNEKHARLCIWEVDMRAGALILIQRSTGLIGDVFVWRGSIGDGSVVAFHDHPETQSDAEDTIRGVLHVNPTVGGSAGAVVVSDTRFKSVALPMPSNASDQSTTMSADLLSNRSVEQRGVVAAGESWSGVDHLSGFCPAAGGIGYGARLPFPTAIPESVVPTVAGAVYGDSCNVRYAPAASVAVVTAASEWEARRDAAQLLLVSASHAVPATAAPMDPAALLNADGFECGMRVSSPTTVPPATTTAPSTAPLNTTAVPDTTPSPPRTATAVIAATSVAPGTTSSAAPPAPREATMTRDRPAQATASASATLQHVPVQQPLEGKDPSSSSSSTHALESIFGGNEEAGEAVAATLPVTAAGIGIAGDPATASRVARLGSSSTAVECAFDEDDSEPSVFEVPFQMRWGATPLAAFRGGIALTGTLVLVAPSLGAEAVARRGAMSAGALRMVATLHATLLAYFSPSISQASMTLLVYAGDTVDAVVAVYGLLAAVVPLALCGVRVWRLRPSRDFVVVRDAGRSLPRIANGHQETRPDDGGMPAAGSAQQFAPYLEPARDASLAKHRLAFVEEVGVGTLLAALAGLRPTAQLNCQIVGLAGFVVALVHLAYMAAVRPFGRRIDLGFAIFNAVTLALVSGLGGLSTVSSDAEGAYWTALALCLLSFYAQAVIALGWGCLLQRRRRSRPPILPTVATDTPTTSGSGDDTVAPLLDTVPVLSTSDCGRGSSDGPPVNGEPSSGPTKRNNPLARKP